MYFLTFRDLSEAQESLKKEAAFYFYKNKYLFQEKA